MSQLVNQHTCCTLSYTYILISVTNSFIVKTYLTRDPNGKERNPNKLWEWPTSTLYGREYYELSVPSLDTPTFGSGPRTEYCAFWDNYLPSLIKGTGMYTISQICKGVQLLNRVISSIISETTKKLLLHSTFDGNRKFFNKRR